MAGTDTPEYARVEAAPTRVQHSGSGPLPIHVVTHLSAINRRRRGRTIEKKIRSIRKYRKAAVRRITLRVYLKSCGFDCSRSIYCHHIDAPSTEPILLRPRLADALRLTFATPSCGRLGSRLPHSSPHRRPTAADASMPWIRQCTARKRHRRSLRCRDGKETPTTATQDIYRRPILRSAGSDGGPDDNRRTRLAGRHQGRCTTASEPACASSTPRPRNPWEIRRLTVVQAAPRPAEVHVSNLSPSLTKLDTRAAPRNLRQ